MVLPFGLAAVSRWLSLPDKNIYRSKLYNALIAACQKAFPENKENWVGPHDLRHSHAIYLLSKGASLTQVALNLRNRIDVCQKYYTGYEHSNSTLDNLKNLIR